MQLKRMNPFHLLVTVMMSRKRLSEEMSIAQSTDSASNSISSMYLTLVSTNRTSEHLGIEDHYFNLGNTGSLLLPDQCFPELFIEIKSKINIWDIFCRSIIIKGSVLAFNSKFKRNCSFEYLSVMIRLNTWNKTSPSPITSRDSDWLRRTALRIARDNDMAAHSSQFLLNASLKMDLVSL